MFTMPHKNSPIVALVGCSALKGKAPAKARDLYRSPLFKAAMAYAEACTEHVAIVSAKYGAVRPDTIIEPYDMKLSSLRKAEREDWGARVVGSLQRWFPQPIFLLLCGDTYSDAILYGAHWHNMPRPQTPMAKMRGIGNRIAWLNEERDSWAARQAKS